LTARARRRLAAPTLVVLLTSLLAALGGAPAPAVGWAGSADPPSTMWGDTVLVSPNRAHRETSLALSPTDPNLLFICDPSGVPNTTYNQSYFHRSTNGGKNWAYLDVEGPNTDPRNYAYEGGDCDVAFDAGGTMYSADTWLGSLSVGHSTDGGNTWTGTSLAATSPIVDRPWLVGGPAGTIHVSYQDLQCCMPSAMWYTRSTDYGQTFLPAVPITAAGPEGAYTWEGNFAVSPNGQDLYLVYTRRMTNNLTNGLDQSGPESVWVAASHNAGLTWESKLVARMPNPASYLYPSIAMDKGGFLHVVFASRTDEDRPIWYAFSKDQANTWTAPLAIRRGESGYSPWVAGGDAGEAAITWYGSQVPMASMSDSVPWHFFWAKVSGADAGMPTLSSGTTTTTPMFTGVSGIPEFEMIQLDSEGRMHIGMSAYRRQGVTTTWAIWYQREILPLVKGSGSVPGEGLGASSFALDVEQDEAGAIAGSLSFADPDAGVTIEALSFDGFSIQKVTGALTCTITGQAEVTRDGLTGTEPFMASCRDGGTSGDSFSFSSASYTGGGALTGGDVAAG